MESGLWFPRRFNTDKNTFHLYENLMPTITISRNKSKSLAVVHRKLSITGGSSVKNRSDSHVSFQENRWGVFGIPSPGSPSAVPGRASPRDPQLKPIQHVDGTYLKHQPEEEHHSNTGNNICMVLDDKLMAQHRRVLVGLFSDPHGDTIRPNFCFTQRRCSLFLPGIIVILLRENAQSSPLLPTSKGPSCN